MEEDDVCVARLQWLRGQAAADPEAREGGGADWVVDLGVEVGVARGG